MPLEPLIERSVLFIEQSATLTYMDKLISKIKKSIIVSEYQGQVVLNSINGNVNSTKFNGVTSNSSIRNQHEYV